MHGFDGSSVSSNEGLSIAKVGLNRWHAIRALRLPDGRTKCSRGRSTWCLFHHVCSSSRYLSNARSMFQEEGRSAPNPVSIKDTANFFAQVPQIYILCVMPYSRSRISGRKWSRTIALSSGGSSSQTSPKSRNIVCSAAIRSQEMAMGSLR